MSHNDSTDDRRRAGFSLAPLVGGAFAAARSAWAPPTLTSPTPFPDPLRRRRDPLRSSSFGAQGTQGADNAS